MAPDFLTVEEVIEIHDDQLLRYGGRAGILDITLLRSAISMPSAGTAGTYFHSDIFQMAAAYLYHIVQNHPFADGNKRTGLASAMVFLYLNGYELEVKEDALEKRVISAAEGKIDKLKIGRFFEAHTLKLGSSNTEGN